MKHEPWGAGQSEMKLPLSPGSDLAEPPIATLPACWYLTRKHQQAKYGEDEEWKVK